MHTLRTLAAAAIAFFTMTSFAVQPVCNPYTQPECCRRSGNGCGIRELHPVSLYDAARVGRVVR